MFRDAGTRGPALAEAAERELTRLEVEAVATAEPTPYAAEFLKSLSQHDYSLVVVSNNSNAAVRSYLHAQELMPFIANVSARTEPNPLLLKPNVYLLDRAILHLGMRPDECVMIGDSISDIEAAAAAGTRSVGLANKPGKARTFATYEPDRTVDDMATLWRAV